ncbi:MAG: tyrosine--tRNA ligase [Armatimonadetes bacterium]|nr:tyrosine--tRNA ligase [Armatimonadota bacterium]
MTVDEQLALLRRGTSEIISEADLKRKLESGKPLRVKLGVDPTVAHVTLGWAVVLRKLRDFQRLGHTAVLIIGDFTAQIGDPSGKSKTRPQLTREEVQANVAEVSKQVYKILDPEKTEITFNADWLGPMGFAEVIKLASKYTVARIMERDDFTNRWNEHRPISMHEILYPLCQGYDSVMVRSDVELGGNDQKFNNLVGRDLQADYGQEGQVVMLCPLLIGTDGKEKMSQSLGNYISVVDTPNDIYGKTMSIPDELLTNWFELCTDLPMDEARELIAANPYDAKKRLAREIVALYHGVSAGDEAERFFKETFSQRQAVTEAEDAVVPHELLADGLVPVANLISALGLAKSNGAARDLMKAGAVSLNDEKVSDPFAKLPPAELDGKILRVGKHQFRRLILPR